MRTANQEIMESISIVSSESNLKVYDSLFNKANTIKNNSTDYNVTDTDNLFYSNGKFCFMPDGKDTSFPVGFQLSKHAFSQLCTKIGVPIRYMNKCIESGMIDLVESNINEWLKPYNKPLFIREHSNKIRGILSDRYQVLDTHDILDVITSVFDSDDITVKGYYISPERFHLRLTQSKMLDIPGEDLFAGFQIDSSDVGRSALEVKFLLYKQVCPNGVCIVKNRGLLFSQRHIGISKEEFREGLQNSIYSFESLIPLVTDMVKYNSSNKVSVETETDKENLFKMISGYSSVVIPKDFCDRVVDLMSERYSNTVWGLVNSITEASQVYTLERRIYMEQIAGNILSDHLN